MTNPEKRRLAWLRGKEAENRAGWFLRMKGYRIIGQNLRLKSGEIDLLVCRGDTLVAVEVKTRETIAEGLEAVGVRKRKRIASAMNEWLGLEYAQGQRKWQDYNLRFDVVVIKKGSLRPYHLEDAYGI